MEFVKGPPELNETKLRSMLWSSYPSNQTPQIFNFEMPTQIIEPPEKELNRQH
jgi:hypothetical protein